MVSTMYRTYRTYTTVHGTNPENNLDDMGTIGVPPSLSHKSYGPV